MSNYWTIPQKPRCHDVEHFVTLSETDMKVAAPIINTVLDNTADAALLVSSHRRVIYISRGFAELTGTYQATPSAFQSA